MTPGNEARRLLRRCHDGALATLFTRLQGYPYVSFVPFMLDHDANPVMLLSRLAEHTKNVEANERVSIGVRSSAEDVQAAPRLTLLGSCRRAGDRDTLSARYLRYFPNAARLLALDFDFYRITVVALRYIGGFGAVHWLAAEDFRPASCALAAIEHSVLEHVNKDHVHDLHDCCRYVYAISASTVRMIGLDCDGIDARADERLVRFDFSHTVHDAASVRYALAALARESRR
jgi:putative heme iron utilization protein